MKKFQVRILLKPHVDLIPWVNINSVGDDWYKIKLGFLFIQILIARRIFNDD
jgi:hypothetical protein